MNTKDKWSITATIQDEHRAAVWGSIFPGARVPIKAPVAYRVELPGHPDAAAYFLDLEAISDEQKEKLIETLAGLFNESEEQVRNDLPRGVPILADDVLVAVGDMAYFSADVDGDRYDHEDLWRHEHYDEWEDD